MKIAIGSDHAGFEYKGRIIEMLTALGHEVRDFGTHSDAPVDYPVYIAPTAEAVARGECERGIVLGGSGNGEQIVANKVHGIRCALCFSLDTARWARLHNDSNVMAIGQRTVSPELALEMVRIWLDTAFEGGRHIPRVNGITAVESNAAPHEMTMVIRPEYLNQRGTLFGGYMMQWADEIAFVAASLKFPQACFVTRRVEAFDFTAPVHNGDIVKISSHIEAVGTSSCKITVCARNARSQQIVFSTTAIMVHIGPDGAKAPIPR